MRPNIPATAFDKYIHDWITSALLDLIRRQSEGTRPRPAKGEAAFR